MELNLTHDILVYNQVVTKQINAMEQAVTQEINGFQIELEKEEVRRVTNDKILLSQVTNFLENLQLPNMKSTEEIAEILAEQKQKIMLLDSREEVSKSKDLLASGTTLSTGGVI